MRFGADSDTPGLVGLGTSFQGKVWFPAAEADGNRTRIQLSPDHRSSTERLSFS